MENKLLKKFMEFGIGSILTLLIGFISSPIITRLVTPEQNGKFSMFTTIGNLLLVIVVLGLDQSYVRFFYDEDESVRGKLLKICIKIPLIVATTLSIFMIIFYKSITNYIVGDISFPVIILLIIYLFTSILLRFSSLQIRMNQKAKLYSLVNIIQKVTNLVFVILFYLIFNNNYYTLVLAIVFSTIVSLLLGMIVEKKVWFTNYNKLNLKTSKEELIRYGLPLIFSMAITWVFQSTDRIAIKQFSGYEELGLYNGAMTIIALLNAVQSTFTTFWTPVAFERYSKNPDDKEFFSNINKIVTVVMLLIATALIASKDLIVLLLGEKYRQAMFIFPYLVFMPVMYTISETTVLGINFKKKSKDHIKIASISAIFNIIGNLLLVPSFGAIGAAISTGVSYVIFFIARTYFSNKYYKVDFEIKKFLFSTLLIYVLATYSSFYKFNLIIIILVIILLISIFVLYKETIKQIFSLVKLSKNKN